MVCTYKQLSTQELDGSMLQFGVQYHVFKKQFAFYKKSNGLLFITFIYIYITSCVSLYLKNVCYEMIP